MNLNFLNNSKSCTFFLNLIVRVLIIPEILTDPFPGGRAAPANTKQTTK